jgi:hypothetical protein
MVLGGLWFGVREKRGEGGLVLFHWDDFIELVATQPLIDGFVGDIFVIFNFFY